MAELGDSDVNSSVVSSTEQRDFFVWVNPKDKAVQHNIGLVGSIAQQAVFPEAAEELMYVFNGQHKQGLVSKFHIGVLRHYAVEYDLERYRCLHYRTLPSRFHALYLFGSRDDAMTYAAEHKDHVNGRVLKRGVSNGPYIYSLHDAAWIDFLRLDQMLDEDTFNVCWRGYWSGRRADKQLFQSHGAEWKPASVTEALFYGRVDFPNKDLAVSD